MFYRDAFTGGAERRLRQPQTDKLQAELCETYAGRGGELARFVRTYDEELLFTVPFEYNILADGVDPTHTFVAFPEKIQRDGTFAILDIEIAIAWSLAALNLPNIFNCHMIGVRVFHCPEPSKCTQVMQSLSVYFSGTCQVDFRVQVLCRHPRKHYENLADLPFSGKVTLGDVQRHLSELFGVPSADLGLIRVGAAGVDEPGFGKLTKTMMEADLYATIAKTLGYFEQYLVCTSKVGGKRMWDAVNERICSSDLRTQAAIRAAAPAHLQARLGTLADAASNVIFTVPVHVQYEDYRKGNPWLDALTSMTVHITVALTKLIMPDDEWKRFVSDALWYTMTYDETSWADRLNVAAEIVGRVNAANVFKTELTAVFLVRMRIERPGRTEMEWLPLQLTNRCVIPNALERALVHSLGAGELKVFSSETRSPHAVKDRVLTLAQVNCDYYFVFETGASATHVPAPPPKPINIQHQRAVLPSPKPAVVMPLPPPPKTPLPPPKTPLPPPPRSATSDDSFETLESIGDAASEEDTRGYFIDGFTDLCESRPMQHDFAAQQAQLLQLVSDKGYSNAVWITTNGGIDHMLTVKLRCVLHDTVKPSAIDIYATHVLHFKVSFKGLMQSLYQRLLSQNSSECLRIHVTDSSGKVIDADIPFPKTKRTLHLDFELIVQVLGNTGATVSRRVPVPLTDGKLDISALAQHLKTPGQVLLERGAALEPATKLRFKHLRDVRAVYFAPRV